MLALYPNVAPFTQNRIEFMIAEAQKSENWNSTIKIKICRTKRIKYIKETNLFSQGIPRAWGIHWESKEGRKLCYSRSISITVLERKRRREILWNRERPQTLEDEGKYFIWYYKFIIHFICLKLITYEINNYISIFVKIQNQLDTILGWIILI